MKIDFSNYDLENFLIKEGVFCGLYSRLIQPNHIGTKFSQKNKIFRSSIWSLDGDLLSASYPKFVNFGENPSEFPVPTNIDGWSFVEKMDGSACIVDYINGMFSARTRGTFSYKDLKTSSDFDLLFDTYPKIKEFVRSNQHISILMEIVTPNMQIVINYKDIDFYLCGGINKNDYSLLTQSELDSLAKEIGVKRPPYYTFPIMDDLLKEVGAWRGKEGIVAYSPCGQHLLKIKSDWYRKLHAAKENFNSIDKVIDFWFTDGCKPYQEFISSLVGQFDYETMLVAQPHISRICDAYKDVVQIIVGMQEFVDKTLKPMATRKDQALKTVASYGGENNSRASMVFALLDSKPLNNDQIKKLLYQCLKYN
jgi:hypothetical protein